VPQTVGSGDYTCNFGFHPCVSEYNDLPGLDDAFTHICGDLIRAGTENDDDDPYFVVAGSNEVRPLSVTTSNTTSPGQDTLQDAANNAEKVVTGEPTPHPFQHFPGRASAPSVALRDPYDVWDTDYQQD